MVSIFFRTIIIYIILTILMKILGKRRIGELEAGEFVSTLLISEIAAMPIGDSDLPIFNAVIPIIFISALEVAISAIKNKSKPIKDIVEGTPTYIIYKGRISEAALTNNRISINEVLSEARVQGVWNIKDIYYAILEPNGKLSIIEKKDKDSVTQPLVIDGAVDMKMLSSMGYNERWLQKKLALEKVKLDEVFLLTVDEAGEVNVIRKEKK